MPFPAASAHPLLEKLEGRLSAHDRAAREMAFRKAHAAIERAASQGGVPQDGLYPFRKTFRDDPRTSERVDIQVEAGRAFVR